MTWICTVEHFDSIVSGWLLQLLSRYRLVQQLLVWRQEEHQTCQSSKGLYRTAPERFLGNIYRNRLNTRNTKWAQEQHAGPVRLTEDVWVKMRLTGAVLWMDAFCCWPASTVTDQLFCVERDGAIWNWRAAAAYRRRPCRHGTVAGRAALGDGGWTGVPRITSAWVWHLSVAPRAGFKGAGGPGPDLPPTEGLPPNRSYFISG